MFKRCFFVIFFINNNPNTPREIKHTNHNFSSPIQEIDEYLKNEVIEFDKSENDDIKRKNDICDFSDHRKIPPKVIIRKISSKKNLPQQIFKKTSKENDNT